jgi:hypothetical protein
MGKTDVNSRDLLQITKKVMSSDALSAIIAAP